MREPPGALETALDMAATYRLVRLLQEDTLPPLPRWRQTILQRWGNREWAELVVCPWCLSVWVAAGVAAARVAFPRAWPYLARILAGSAVAGLVSDRLDE